jgi:large subunit ribosomal protein L5
VSRLKEKFVKEVTPALMSKFNYKSVMQVPQLDKIVINMGVGDAVANAKALDNAVEELATITGQKPVVTRAKKSIAGFRLREGMPIGAKVTLRGERMYQFLDKLVSVSLTISDSSSSESCFGKYSSTIANSARNLSTRS